MQYMSNNTQTELLKGDGSKHAKEDCCLVSDFVKQIMYHLG